MSWEAGQLCKKMEASWWGVVTNLWWPRFRTQTHTHKEADQVYAMRSGRCGKRRMAWEHETTSKEKKALLLFSMHPYCSSSDHRLDTCLPLGQQVVKHVLLGSTDSGKKRVSAAVMNKAWKIEFGVEASSADVHDLFSFVGFVHEVN